jgi:hypothetical protein
MVDLIIAYYFITKMPKAASKYLRQSRRPGKNRPLKGAACILTYFNSPVISSAVTPAQAGVQGSE